MYITEESQIGQQNTRIQRFCMHQQSDKPAGLARRPPVMSAALSSGHGDRVQRGTRGNGSGLETPSLGILARMAHLGSGGPRHPSVSVALSSRPGFRALWRSAGCFPVARGGVRMDSRLYANGSIPCHSGLKTERPKTRFGYALVLFLFVERMEKILLNSFPADLIVTFALMPLDHEI